MLADELRLLSAALLLSATIHSMAFADARPPAGQQCPTGAYVTGFDQEGNILCSEPVREPGATSGTVVVPGQGRNDAAAVAAPGSATAGAATGASANRVSPPAPSDARPAITDIEPWSVVYGQRSLDVVITGSGFISASTVVFNGQRHDVAVNSAGTELRVTLDTAGLAIGQYPIKVVNGPGSEASRKRAIVVY